MSLAVTILGSSGMFQTLDRACSGYLLQFDGNNIWLDAGSGTWRNLLSTIDYADLSGVLLTHGHPDHTTDVLQAYHARQYGQQEALPRLPLWAPQETIDRLSAFSKGLEDAFELRPVGVEDEVVIGGATFSFTEMAHPVQTLGVRVSYEGKVVAFSSDTGADADFTRLAGDADVFVCEATSQDADEVWEGHLQASETGRIARELGVKRLVLTHLRPGSDDEVTLAEARGAAGDVQVELAQDGSRLEIG